MKYKTLLFSVALIGLLAASTFLASVSVNSKNTGPNAKREHTPISEVTIGIQDQSESNNVGQTFTLPNAKREKI